MVENLLSVTRIDRDGGAIKRTDELLEEVIGSAVSRFEKNHGDVRISIDIPDKPLLISVDPILIEQVLLNLMDNCVFHGEGLTEIRISVKVLEKEIEVGVFDDGCGFPEDVLPHLFDGTLPFLKTDQHARSGMRIGLSVCRSIVRAHGGILFAENRKTGGAGVIFTIPLSEHGN